jgi:outer membrane protein OmpA-like peptidoglycan-associated protein
MKLMQTVSAALLVLAGCSTAQPPRELLSARSAYARASSGPAAAVVPDEIHKAQVALDLAERSFTAEPESAATRDLSYVAERKAQLAEAKGQIVIAGQDRAGADRQFKQTLSDQKDQAVTDAERSRQQAAMSDEQRRAESDRHAGELRDAQARTDAEAAGRAAAEAKSQSLMADLALLGQLREEERGTVITLSGDVIFVTNQAILLASAQTRLDKIAEVLKRSEHRLVIEGHTDSRGSDQLNEDLSKRRASATRDYLVSRGVPSDHIQVSGFGKTRPIADNNSAEGRAMNRRVEIIVEGMRAVRK